MNTKAETAAITIPITHAGTPRAVEKVEPMELDCTIAPMQPRERMMATAKKPARKEPSLPLNALLI